MQIVNDYAFVVCVSEGDMLLLFFFLSHILMPPLSPSLYCQLSCNGFVIYSQLEGFHHYWNP